jgi:hypothetical protein
VAHIATEDLEVDGSGGQDGSARWKHSCWPDHDPKSVCRLILDANRPEWTVCIAGLGRPARDALTLAAAKKTSQRVVMLLLPLALIMVVAPICQTRLGEEGSIN